MEVAKSGRMAAAVLEHNSMLMFECAMQPSSILLLHVLMAVDELR